MPPSASTGRNPHGAWISALILLVAFCLYFFSIDSHAPSIRRNNFVLDADLVPVANVIAKGHTRNLQRHPLYGMFLGAPGTVVDSVLRDPITTGRCSSAAAGAVASLIAFWFFVRLLGSRVEAIWFCLLVSCSSSVWLLASIPETHIYNHLAVLTGFVLLCAMRGETAPARLSRWTWLAVLAGVFLMGITLTNIVYVTLAVGLALATAPIPFRQRAVRFAAFLGAVLVLFVAFSALALHLRPDEFNFLTAPAAPLNNRFVRWDGLFDPGSLLPNARMFLLGNVIASPPKVDLVLTLGGIQQMIQLDEIGRPEMLILAYLALALGTLAARRSEGRFGPAGLFAVLVISFNLALHQVFSGNGQPFIFSIHTVAPLVVLLALFYRKSRVATKHLLIGGLASVIVVQNALFLLSVNELLSRKCLQSVQDPAICVIWSPTMSP